MARSSIRDWVRRIRDADNVEEAVQVASENNMPPESSTGARRESVARNPEELSAHDELGASGSHTHIYLGGGKGATSDDPVPTGPSAPPGAAAPADVEGRLAAIESEVGEMRNMLEQLLGEDEGEMELEDPETHDARRFNFRRGAKMRSKDELELPVHRPELIGETDLPGTEDLNDGPGPGVTGDRRRYRDSADMEHTWAEAIAAAEVIVPGFRMPTFDARLEPARTGERLCALRRRVMDTALQTAETAKVIKEVTGLTSRDQIMGKAMSCDALKMAFNYTASALRGQTNQNSVRRDMPVVSTGDRAKPPSLAEMNQRHKDFWKNNPAGTRH